MNTFKSSGAVLVGFITVAVLSVATDFVLETLGIFPPQSESGSYTSGMLLIALMYRSIYAVVGGYITATLATNRPMRHTIILGFIGLVFATLGAIANWNKTTPSTEWYPILLIVFTLPCVWSGGKLKLATSKNK